MLSTGPAKNLKWSASVWAVAGSAIIAALVATERNMGNFTALEFAPSRHPLLESGGSKLQEAGFKSAGLASCPRLPAVWTWAYDPTCTVLSWCEMGGTGRNRLLTASKFL